MSDVTQGQDVAQSASPEAGLPDAHELFPDNLPDANETFPDKKPYSQTVRNVSPLQDTFFSDPGRSHARVLDAFGYGFKQGWGAAPQEFSEADDALRKAGIYNDYSKGQHNIIKAANEAVMRPAVAALLTVKGALSGAFSGAQAAVAQEGEELGAPNLGREIAAIPEAFPAGFHQMTGIPHAIAAAKSLDVIGAGEGGYFGTKPVVVETPLAAAEAAKAQDIAKPEGLPGHDPEAGPSPVAQPAAAPAAETPAPAAPDIHTVARQIAPETFSEFDALSQKKDTFRRWIDELREVRDQTAREGAPHADEIADLQQKLTDATPRLAKKYQARLDPLVEERDAYISEHTKGDSADMAKIRQQLMQADYRQRDLAPDVSKAYRAAQERMPQQEAAETPATEAVAHEPTSAEAVPAQVPAATEAAVEPVKAGAEASEAPSANTLIEGSAKASEAAGKQAIAPTEPTQAEPEAKPATLPIAHAPSIVADVSQKLKAAGRPAAEADAAAQVVAAYWETRAQRFEGAKGTAAEMYAHEAPEIKLGKDKAKQAPREMEMAQTATRQGRIRLPDFPFLRDGGGATITLLKKADASTFIHETGHEWLGRMLADADDPAAPAPLKTDAQTVLKWLGVDSPDGVKTSHHEKFARGFETYMLEGRAPSSALARVFAKFKDWLTTIYKTVAALKAPISDDIRGVFDRLLAEKPEKTVIAPERETAAGLAEAHEDLVEPTKPVEAYGVATNIEAERDSHAAQNLVENQDNDTRLGDTGAETERRAPGSAQPSGDADAARPDARETEGAVGSGAVGEGGNQAAAEGNRVHQKPAAEHPLDATADLPKSETQLIDKAGNIRLDNLGTPEDVSAVIRATAIENDDFIDARRGVLPDAEVLKLADALGMSPEKIADRKLGQAFNAEQIIAARKLLIQSAGNVRDLAAKIAGGTETDVLAYAEARARHLMIQEQVSGITAEAGRALRAFRSLEGSKEAADISAFLQNTQGKTLYQMKEEGALLAMMGTPQQVSKAVHEASLTRWQKTRSGILSWYINNLISGPITHAGYSIGNTVVQMFKATVDTSVAAAMGALRNAPAGERVYFGEVGAQLYGMVRGMRDGYSPALTALKTGVPYMKGDVEGLIGQIEAAHRPQAIPGKIGYVMETPSRAVTAIHTMHYSMNYEAEIARRAYRSAVGEGLEPGTTEFNAKVADFTQSPPQAEMEAAHDEAMKMVLMKKTQFGTAQYHLQKAVNSNILAKVVMPFMQVGANILHESFVERTPIGFASQTVRDNLSGKNGTVAQHSQAARISVGIGISTAVIGLTAEGILTGGGPSDPKHLAIKEMTGWRPYSIRVGESYVPYRKYLGGLGPLIAGTADMYEVGHALNEEGLTKAAASALFGFAEVIADESWAKGLANFIDAARHWDRDGGRYLRNLAGNFIPGSIGLQQLATLNDPYRREVRTMLDVARAHIPGMSQGLFPVRDIWGEPILSHTALGASQANHDPATQSLLDAGYYPGRLDRKIRSVELTDQQYDDVTRLAGRMSRMRVNALVNTPGFAQLPKQVRAEKLRDVISDPQTGARESARAMVMMQSMHGDNNIITKASDAKLSKLRGAPAH